MRLEKETHVRYYPRVLGPTAKQQFKTVWDVRAEEALTLENATVAECWETLKEMDPEGAGQWDADRVLAEVQSFRSGADRDEVRLGEVVHRQPSVQSITGKPLGPRRATGCCTRWRCRRAGPAPTTATWRLATGGMSPSTTETSCSLTPCCRQRCCASPRPPARTTGGRSGCTCFSATTSSRPSPTCTRRRAPSRRRDPAWHSCRSRRCRSRCRRGPG